MSITLQPLSQQSTPELIADQLRVKILDGTFPPHHQLAEVELARQLQVSRGPVREALQRLIQEGLVRSERNRGVFVIEMTDEDARDVYNARGAVEKAAAVLVARRSDPDDLDAVESVLDRLRESVRRSWPEVVEIDLEFHATIVDCSGSPRLQRMFRTLAAETRLCIARLEEFYPVRSNVVTEHEEIFAAIRDGDEELVKRLIDVHMTEAADRLSHSFLQEHH